MSFRISLRRGELEARTRSIFLREGTCGSIMFAPNADGHRRQRGLKEDAIRYSNADAKAAGFTAGLRADDECSPSTKRNEEMKDGGLSMKCSQTKCSG